MKPRRTLRASVRGTLAAAAAVGIAAAWLALGCSVSSAPQPRPAIDTPLFAHPGACGQCHDSMRNGIPTEATPPSRCATADCHPALVSGSRFVHGPVAVGDCRACHRQHSAVERHLLITPATPLCLGCHDRLITCPAAADAALERCVGCHDAHGGLSHLLRPAPRPDS